MVFIQSSRQNIEDPEVPWLGLCPRPSSNFSRQRSSLSKSGGGQSSSRSSRDSPSGSRSLQNSRTSVSSVVVQPKQDNGQRHACRRFSASLSVSLQNMREAQGQIYLVRLKAEERKSDKCRWDH